MLCTLNASIGYYGETFVADGTDMSFPTLVLALVVTILYRFGKVGKSSKEVAVETELKRLPDAEAVSAETIAGIKPRVPQPEEENNYWLTLGL